MDRARSASSSRRVLASKAAVVSSEVRMGVTSEEARCKTTTCTSEFNRRTSQYGSMLSPVAPIAGSLWCLGLAAAVLSGWLVLQLRLRPTTAPLLPVNDEQSEQHTAYRVASKFGTQTGHGGFCRVHFSLKIKRISMVARAPANGSKFTIASANCACASARAAAAASASA